MLCGYPPRRGRVLSREPSRPSGYGGVAMTKRIVGWGAGFVGKLVIPEIVRHPVSVR